MNPQQTSVRDQSPIVSQGMNIVERTASTLPPGGGVQTDNPDTYLIKGP